MAEDPKTTTFQVRPGGSRRVEKDPDTGVETLVLVDPDTAPNESPGGNVGDTSEPEDSLPGTAAAISGKRRR